MALALAPYSMGEDRHQVDVWYGTEQHVGQFGQPQNWVNILGRARGPGKLSAVSYQLNGATAISVSLGPDGRRLEHAGDFNADIPWDALRIGSNTVQITASWEKGVSRTTTINVHRHAGEAQLPMTLKWSEVTTAQDRSLVVDGKWSIEDEGLRSTEPGYDRFVAIGDVAWTNYEVLVPITLHDLSSASGGVGILTRWNGHTDHPIAGFQPKAGFMPLGCIGWYRGGQLELYGNESIIHDRKKTTLEEGQTYVFRMQVQSDSLSRTRYRLKVWHKAKPEPTQWDLDALQEGGPTGGSIMLTAHQHDVTFGDIKVVALMGKN